MRKKITIFAQGAKIPGYGSGRSFVSAEAKP
jgi:hypothetical protein